MKTNQQISDEKDTIQKFLESEERWRSITQYTPDYIMQLDLKGNILLINRTVPDLSLEEVIGKPIYQFVPENYRENMKKVFEKVLSTGELGNYETGYRDKKGDDYFFEAQVSPLYDSDQIIGYLVRSADITKRKMAEQTLIESETKFRNLSNQYEMLLESITDSVFALNSDWEYILVNKSAEKTNNISRDNIIGHKMQDLFPGIEETPFFKVYESVMITRNEERIIESFTHPDGETKFYDLSVYPIQQGILCISKDVTKERKIQKELKESEEKWKALSENTPAIVSLLDREHKIFSINRTAPDLSKEEVIGSSVYNYVPPEFLQVARDSFNSVWETGEPTTYAQKYITKEGETRFFEVWIGPVFQSGKIFALVSHSMDVTEKKGVELKLKESEEKFRGFLDYTNIGMAITSLDKKWIYCNDQICEILGFTREELFEKTWADLSYPEDLQSDVEQFDNILDGKIDSYQKDNRYIKKNGEILYAHLTVSCIRNIDGTVRHFLATLQDITERKIAEQELKKSEEKYRILFESSKDGIMFTNMEGIIIDCNQAFLDMLGYTLGEIKEISYHQLTPEKWHERSTDIFNNQFLPKGYTGEFEKEYIRKDGTIVPISINVWLIKDDQGNNKGMWAIVRNITERKKAELKLKESKEKYNNLFQYSNDAILLHDFEGNILEVNDRASELFKYPKEEILAITTPMLRTTEEQERREALSKEFSKKGFIKFEFNFVKKDGTIFPGEVSSRAIEIKGKKVIQAEIRDISERKLVEQKLREVNRLKSEFLRRASHELKTPLISIKGFSDLILSLYADQLDPAIISKLGEINNGCERLQNIINNLLKTSRLESSDVKPKLQKEDLSFLIKFCLHELEPLAERRNQSINLDIQNDLYAFIEKEEIHDVISNLLTNAIKYTPPNGKIEVITDLKEDSVIISVKDNGIGFTNEQKKKIFQQFGKIERYGQGLDLGIDGTGLGLYISKRIVESHGGKIWMESEGKSRGSTFYFTLPRTK